VLRLNEEETNGLSHIEGDLGIMNVDIPSLEVDTPAFCSSST
jgi:hypothetical protein